MKLKTNTFTPVDYSILETNFHCACEDVIKDLTNRYKLSYQAGGPGMLDSFFELIKTEFDKATLLFIADNKLGEDAEALKRIQAIAKKHAKKCLDFYGKVK